MKRFVCVCLSLVLLFTTGAASLSVYGKEKTADFKSQQQKSITFSRFETMLNNNYAYAEDFISVSSLIKSSTVSLLNHSENGEIENTLIIDFVKNLYGIDPAVMADEGENVLIPIEKTKIIPRGFSKFTHTVVKTHLNSDGTYTVYSLAKGYNEDKEITLDAVSRFAVNGQSTFGFNLLSCELLLKEESAMSI